MTGPPAPVAEVRTAVRRWLHTALAAGQLRPGDPPVTVACSGGADSLALAAATTFEAPRLGFGVRAVTVDHGLQDGSAERAEALAHQLTELGCDPVVVRRVEVGTDGGPEAAARSARYGALRSARPAGGWVLLGHTLDDQAETVLLGLGRGSGPRSLAGMRAADRPWGRPLLGVRRQTTRAACAALGLSVWDDPHNADPRYTRVRLRTEALPLLDDILSGGAAEALARSAELIRADVDALDAYAEHALADLRTRPAEPPESLDAAALAALPTAVRRRVLRSWLADRGAGALTAAHLNAVDALVTAWRGQGPVDLPRGVQALRRHGRLTSAGSGTVGRSEPPRRAPEPDDSRTQIGSALTVYDGDIERVLIDRDQLAAKITELAGKISTDYAGRELLLVGVLKGAVMFMSDLARELDVPTQLEFMAVSSYGGSTSSSGIVRILKGLDQDIAGRDVLVVEDIIDSGLTLSWLVRNLAAREPASLAVCALLRKPDALRVDVDVRYVGFDIPNEFVVGYGLDYAERYRDLPHIATLRPEVYGGGSG